MAEYSKSPDSAPGPIPKYPNFHPMMLVIFLFTISYSLLGMWLLFDGYLNSFSSLYWLWGLDDSGFPAIFRLAIFSLVGSILGCATLDIVSFHKYIAIKKVFDLDHIWGFFFSPILASIIGLIVFALFQSGLLVFSGNLSTEESPVTAELGFTAIGFVAGYSWHDVVSKFREISDGFFRKEQNGKPAGGRKYENLAEQPKEVRLDETTEETIAEAPDIPEDDKPIQAASVRGITDK